MLPNKVTVMINAASARVKNRRAGEEELRESAIKESEAVFVRRFAGSEPLLTSFKDKDAGVGGRHVELWSGLIDDNFGQARQRQVGVCLAQVNYAAINFEKHFAFVRTHVKEPVAAGNIGSDDGSACRRDPEARSRHIGDMPEDVGHPDMRARVDVFEIKLEQLGIARRSVAKSAAKIFHAEKDKNEMVIQK